MLDQKKPQESEEEGDGPQEDGERADLLKIEPNLKPRKDSMQKSLEREGNQAH
jgi:hypothetical protein